MKLSDLLQYDDIIVQCHDNPDADAIASGYGIYTYLKEKGKKARFVYSGRFPIKKSNLVLMIKYLKIPIEYAEKPEDCELLVTADCQYGESNVSAMTAKHIAVIDHHQIYGDEPKLSEIRSHLASCSTIVWNLLNLEGYPVEENKSLITALYYGLYTDTNGFSEVKHPLDRDLRDAAGCDKSLLRLLKNSNLSLEELSIAGEALTSYSYYEEYQFAIVQAAPCDPNILGIISDMMLEVDAVRTCLVYSVLSFGVKLSVRSCVKETKASDLAEYLCHGVGSGGGHLDKAGGFLQKDIMGDTDVKEFLKGRMESYFRDSEVIYAASYEADISSMTEYEKLPIKLGYVKATDVVGCGRDVSVRTLEGDLEMDVTEDLYIMIGIDGEVYPNREEKFLRSYERLEEPYCFEGEYAPIIKDLKAAKNISLVDKAKTCITTGVTHIYAKPIDHITKIFTAWDPEKYMLGKPGDYIAVRTDDHHDVYIIAKDIFWRTYKKAE